jgi:hypothetical protein
MFELTIYNLLFENYKKKKIIIKIKTFSYFSKTV